MAFIELSTIVNTILGMGGDIAKKKLSRQEAVISILKRLNLENLPPANDFEMIYAYTLVEYGVDKPEPVLNFFRHAFIREAFRKAFYENNPAILQQEADEIIQWNQETRQLGVIDYDPRFEFAAFTAVYHRIIDNSRSPAEVRRDQKLEDVHANTEKLIARIGTLNNLDALREVIRSELAQLALSPSMPAHETASSDDNKDVIRWLHLSDFHVGKDGYGQRQLFRYILSNVRERALSGRKPDLVFITGDIANKGLDQEYKEFYENFYIPLLEYLPPASQDCIFIVPGNHDVDRTQARAVQTQDVLLRVPEFLDPTELGQFERGPIFPRFKAFIDNDLANNGDHWLNLPQATFRHILAMQGIKVGVVGVNTAWLSCSDDDRHKLSVGKVLLEDGLALIQECDIKIVLGHHPIDWFLDTEVEPVRALLGRYGALYLHGHMHKGRARYEEGGGYPFLALQSGASFQARENEVWVNRFLWCELDIASRNLNIEPVKWSNDHQNWVVDGDAFPPRYQQGTRWMLPLPSPATQHTVVNSAPMLDRGRLIIPDGWSQVDSAYLAGRHKELTNEQAISFFDGRAPIWREALAPQIPRRQIVGRLVSDLEAGRREGGLRVTLLTGAAGEGKTTALLQTITDLVSSGADWHILWHHDTATPLPAEFLSRLPETGTWLVVSDDAEVIVQRVFSSVQALRSMGRKNVQFLLCCRDTDWNAERAENLSWNYYATFVTHTLRGLTQVDSEKVVSAWALYGKDGLKTLDDLGAEKAAAQLFKAARSEESNRGEGSFFGAILQTRWGEGLKSHIDNLLSKLVQFPLSTGKTLLDAFAYIAAMHAENLQILSKEVLADVLGISYSELKKTVLSKLGDEAVIATTGRLVFTRHRAIANTVLEILVGKYDFDLDDLYVDLVRAARQAYVTDKYFVPDPGKWRYLSSHFFDKNNQALGIRLAHTVLDLSPGDPYLIVRLSQLYRKAGQPEKSLQLFHSIPYKATDNERPFYYEWGTTEGKVGNHTLSVWLAAFSLADGTAKSIPNNDHSKLALSGLAIAFDELYQNFNAPVFAAGCGASAQLGLIIENTPMYVNELRNLFNAAHSAGVDKCSPLEALARLQAGAAAAWEQREADLPEWITPGNALAFNGLAHLLRIS